MIVYQIGDGQAISSVLRGIGERRRRRGCDCVCVFPPFSISVIKNHTGRVCAAEAVTKATGEEDALEATQSKGGKLHIVFAHEIKRCTRAHFGNQRIGHASCTNSV